MTTATAPTATSKPAASQAPAPRLAIGYNPESQEALLANCEGGNLAFAFSTGPAAQGPELVIKPGLNIGIDPELWAKAKELDTVQSLLALNVIQELPLPDESTPLHAPGVVTLGRVDDTAARRLIHMSRDLDQLKSWLKAETRPAIRKALGLRIREVDTGSNVELD